MTAMDQVNNKVHHFISRISSLADWKRLSSTQKLLGLTIFASIVTIFMERWGLLAVLIISMVGFAYVTDKALSAGWLASPDPLAFLLGKLDMLRETLCIVFCRMLNTNRVTQKQELRERSESIASSHIPDLDVDVDSGAIGSTYHKKIRLELNSIILLIIRDFVQFWYNSFSYNSQFLKDARQFLFRGFHNLVERVSRLGPQKTSAKVIHAYRKHVSSFQMAQSTYHAEKNQTRHQNSQTKSRTKLKKLESLEDTFQVEFQLHPALKSKEAEKRYLQSLTKVILLCSCNREVISPVSAQLFFIEILSVNVLLPVVEMLSNPDQIYEILIRLTYKDNSILDEQTVKELIDVEVKRMQLKNVSKASTFAPSTQSVAQVMFENNDREGMVCSDDSEMSWDSGECATQSSEDANENAYSTQAVETVNLTANQMVKRKSKGCDSSPDLQVFNQSQNPMTKTASLGNLRASKNLNDTDGNDAVSDLITSMTPKLICPEKKATEINESTIKEDQTVLEQVKKEVCKFSETNLEPAADNNTLSAQGNSKSRNTTISSSSETVLQQDNHIYGEIVSTNVPIVKPKLQAFKDLFRSKKSKQVEENKSGIGQDKDLAVCGDVQKNQSDTNGIASSENSLSAVKLKSLRLSPLLNRSAKLPSENHSTNGPSASQTKKGSTDGGKSGADSGSDKQTPSPLPTPSPSQPSKSGPLSFFRFRKPTLEFRKSALPAVEDKQKDSMSTSTGSLQSEETENSVASGCSPVPSVQITDESSDDTNRKVPSVSENNMNSPISGQSVSISSYVEIPAPCSTSPDHEEPSSKLQLFARSVEEVEEGEEMEVLGLDGEEEGSVAPPPDSSLIFQDIAIRSTMTCQEFRSNSQFTVYHIEYEALHFSESGIPVMKTGVAKRRYREFVNLMSRLEDNPAYKRLLKDVKGPKRWLTLPFKNMDKESVASRQKALEQFLKSLIDVEAVCNGPEMREFLAYEGDSHIAFVKKATEINVPRIDKMLARTVSGVFDKLKSLPSLPQEVISGIRGRDSMVERKEGVETDTDSINVFTEFCPDTPFDNLLRDISENYIRDIQTQGHPDPTPSSPTSQLLKDVGSNLYNQILLHVPRVEGDGAEDPDDAAETGVGVPGCGQLLLCDAILDLVVQLLTHQQHWLCHQRVLTALRNVLGRTMDRWLKESVSSLTTEERCLYYIRLLRETVWPGGKLFSSQQEGKTEDELVATRNIAKRLILDFFPGAISLMIGTDSMENGMDTILDSLQYRQLNKHFLYTTIDMLLENLFPEIADPQFQNRLLS